MRKLIVGMSLFLMMFAFIGCSGCGEGSITVINDTDKECYVQFYYDDGLTVWSRGDDYISAGDDYTKYQADAGGKWHLYINYVVTETFTVPADGNVEIKCSKYQ